MTTVAVNLTTIVFRALIDVDPHHQPATAATGEAAVSPAVRDYIDVSVPNNSYNSSITDSSIFSYVTGAINLSVSSAGRIASSRSPAPGQDGGDAYNGAWNEETGGDDGMPSMAVQLAIRTAYVYIIPPLALPGIVLNVFAAVLLTSRRMCALPSAPYVKGVIAADVLCLASLLHAWMADVRGFDGLSRADVTCNVDAFVEGAARFLSVWLTVAFAIARVLALRWPRRHLAVCGAIKARAFVVVLTAVAIVLSLNASLTVGYMDVGGKRFCRTLSGYDDVVRHVEHAQLIITGLLPLLLATVCLVTYAAICIGKKNRDIRNRNRIRTASVSLRNGNFNCANNPAPIVRANIEDALSSGAGNSNCKDARHVSRFAAPTSTNRLNPNGPMGAGKGRVVVLIDSKEDAALADDNSPAFFFVYVGLFVVLNSPLYVAKSVHALKALTSLDGHPSLNDFLLEHVLQYLYYAKMAINFFLLLSHSAFRQNALQGVRVARRTLSRLRRLRVTDECDGEEDDDDDVITSASDHEVNASSQRTLTPLAPPASPKVRLMKNRDQEDAV